jgi:gamma-glutamyltranspeptidase/glutathione hydrolase
VTIEHGFESGQQAFRPVVRGTRLMVSSGHYLGSLAGMRMLERGGNAIDAGVAAGFAQVVVEFQSAGFGGECPILIYSTKERRVVAVNGNTRAPRAATVRAYRRLGFDLIPHDGFLSAGVCATPGALLTALERYGALAVADVLAPAIELAGAGFPMYEALQRNIASALGSLRTWPSSAALLLQDGAVPEIGSLRKNPDLAATYTKLVEAEQNARSLGREGAIRAARDRFYTGDIARAIVEFQRETKTSHAGGPESSGLLTEEDFASFDTRVEPSVTTDYRGLCVHKCGPWSQGPVLLQQLRLLEGFDLRGMGPGSADLIHTIVECAKLAFADRERYYGDPDFVRVPLEGLLSKEYAAKRRALVDPRRASLEQRPGDPEHAEALAQSGQPVASRPWLAGTTGARAVDAHGNMYSATPSGGWLRSSPVIPGLGFALGSRLQAFWLDETHPDGLAPRKQPRTTLTPTLVTQGGRAYLAFGTPGGDQQDQWNLQFLINVVDFGMDIQDALDRPAFNTEHFASSFHPREERPGEVQIEPSVPEIVRDELAARGHRLRLTEPMSLGNLTAVRIDHATGTLEASATSRGQKAYAIGW